MRTAFRIVAVLVIFGLAGWLALRLWPEQFGLATSQRPRTTPGQPTPAQRTSAANAQSDSTTAPDEPEGPQAQEMTLEEFMAAGSDPGESAADDAKGTAYQTPLVRALGQAVDQGAKVLGDSKPDLDRSLAKADRALSQAKSRNRDVLRDANRQVRTAGRSPNILIVIVEDLNREDLGCYGQPLFETPKLDALAGSGVRLERFAGSAAGQGAELDALWTGNLPTTSGSSTSNNSVARASQFTLPAMLWQSGYSTVLLGDCSWGGVSKDGTPGIWDDWFGWPSREVPNNQSDDTAFAVFPRAVMASGQKYRIPDNANANRVRFERLMCDELSSWLGEQRNLRRPAAALVALRLDWWKQAGYVHNNYRDRDWSLAQKQHASAVLVADRLMGELVTRIDAASGTPRPIVFVVGLPREKSDPELAMFREAWAAETGAAAQKPARWPWAPLLVRWPGTIAAGDVVTATGGFSDFMPTLADMISSTRRPQNIQGRSLLTDWLPRGTRR